jgi:hypothetical protein
MLRGAGMRIKTLLVLLGATALGAYHVGRHGNPVAQPPLPVAKAVAARPLYHPPLPRPRPQVRTDPSPVSIARSRD